MNSAPLTGPLDAQTFRNIAKAQAPMVVNIRTEMKARAQDLTDFFGGGGGGRPTISSTASSAVPGGRTRPGPPPAAGGDGQGGSGAGAARADDARRGHRASSSARTASSSRTTTSSRTRRRSKCRSTATTTTSLPGEVVGRDPLTDSALIQLIEKPNHPLPEAKFGDSSQMAAGRLGDGDRQPVRLRADGHRRRHQRDQARRSR